MLMQLKKWNCQQDAMPSDSFSHCCISTLFKQPTLLLLSATSAHLSTFISLPLVCHSQQGGLSSALSRLYDIKQTSADEQEKYNNAAQAAMGIRL